MRPLSRLSVCSPLTGMTPWPAEASPRTYHSKVVLMAPCSITHHSDMHQRYEQLELVVEPPPVEGTVQAKAPKNATYAPRGFYMMFMLTSQGVPSVASWVHLL